MFTYPGLELAAEQDKMRAADNASVSDKLDFAELRAAGLLPQTARKRRADEQEAEDDVGLPHQTVLMIPTMADLVRANDAVLDALRSRTSQLESMGERVLGTELCAEGKASPRFPGDTVSARLWRQNTELFWHLERLGRAIERLQQFA